MVNDLICCLLLHYYHLSQRSCRKMPYWPRRFKCLITKTYLYNFDPLKPHFYIVKLGLTGVYIIFLISAQNIVCGYSLEQPRRGGSNEYPQSMFWAELWKISEFLYENFQLFGGEIFNIFEYACFRNVFGGWADNVVRAVWSGPSWSIDRHTRYSSMCRYRSNALLKMVWRV